MNANISNLLRANAEEQAQQIVSARQAEDRRRQLIAPQGEEIERCLTGIVLPELYDFKVQMKEEKYHADVKTEPVHLAGQARMLMEVEIVVYRNERAFHFSLQYRGNAELGTVTVTQDLAGVCSQDKAEAVATITHKDVESRLERFVREFIEREKAANQIIRPAFSAA